MYPYRPLPPKRRRRTHSLPVWVVATLLLLAGVILYVRLLQQNREPLIAAAEATPVLAAGLPVVASPPPREYFSYAWLRRNPPPAFSQLTAQAAFLVDLGSGEVLYAKNEHEKRAPASTTKILTAIVALETSDPSQRIVVSERAARAEPNVMGLRAGEVLALDDLLYGMLLDSGNDAAIAVAEGTLGYDAFVRAMNAKVQELGLQDSRFSNPTGYDEDYLPHYSSAYDLAVLAKYGLERVPGFRTYVSAKERRIEKTDTHGWFGPTNLNRLLWTYPGASGVKPGWTPDAGYCLVAAAERDGRQLLVVVLGSRQHFTDAALLLDYGFSQRLQE